MTCYCYIVECSDGTYYTGWTTDPGRRLDQHNKGRGARYTRTRRPVALVYVESQENRAAAMKRELAIKALSREKKAELLSTTPAKSAGTVESTKKRKKRLESRV